MDFLLKVNLAILLAIINIGHIRAEIVNPIIVTGSDKQLGNAGFTPEGRMIFTYHPFGLPNIRVAELKKDGSVLPFPNASWNSENSLDSMRIDSALGVKGDTNGIIWILDTADRSNSIPKLVGWDTQKNSLAKIIYLPKPITHSKSFLDDLSIDLKHNAIYITDASISRGGLGEEAALIVINLKTGNARRVLHGDKSVIADRHILFRTGGPNGPVQKIKDENGNPVDRFVGADGIVSDIDNEWLYYSPFSSNYVYRIRTSYLRDESLNDQELSKKVEIYGKKEVNGGISIDIEGNVYSTNVQDGGVDIIKKDKSIVYIANDAQLVFPDGQASEYMLGSVDGLSYSPDGYFYGAAFAISKKNRENKIFWVKIKPKAPSVLTK